MVKPIRAKQERIIEAVRQGLEGDDAVEFIHRSGFAITPVAVARYLRSLGGRGGLQDLIARGLSNIAILQHCFPKEDFEAAVAEEPNQGELFELERFRAESHSSPFIPPQPQLFETTKVTVHLPTDLYEAIKLAARAEGKKRNDLIVEILTSALSQMPNPPEQRSEDSGTD